jgi:ferric-dicitrate binding protein FerR (iron transport regulator)
MNERLNDGSSEDESLGLLLRESGARETPSAEMMSEVRQAVHSEWQSMVAQRQRRRWYVGTGLAAGIAAVAIAVVLNLQTNPAAVSPMATLARAEGSPQVSTDGGHAWHALANDTPLQPGTLLRTDATARIALDVHPQVSLRMDANSLLALETSDRIALDQGAVYVDTNPQARANMHSGASDLVIETAYGSVRHLGTQYEARIREDAVAVTVREGHVAIDSADRHYAGAMGERILISAQGTHVRSVVSPQDPSWDWAIRLAPGFDIERQSLSRFLEWVARETGKQIEYASPEVRTRADQLILRGSVEDLPPEQALLAVLATTPFTRSADPSTIRIQLP